MKFCGKCGNKIEGVKKFCPKCGAPVTSSTEKSNLVQNNKPTPISSINTNTIHNESTSSTYNLDNSNNKSTIEPAKKEIKKKTEHKINKKLIISLVSILSALLVIIVLAVVGKMFLNKKFSPENIVTSFSSAIKNEDVNTLKTLLFVEDENDRNVLFTDENLTELINYYKDNSNELNNIVKALKKDCNRLDNLLSSGDDSLLKDDENFAITIDKKNILYSKYTILVKPIYVKVTTALPDTKVFVGDNMESIATIKDSKQVGPLLPIESELTFKAAGLNDDIVETKTIYTYDTEINIFDDYGYVSLSSNFDKGTIFINNEDTGIKISEVDDKFGPLQDGDVLYTSYIADGIEYYSKTVYYSTYKESATLDFYSYDLEKLKNASTSSSSTTITSGNVDDYITKYKNKDYIISSSNSTELTFKDLNNYTVEELFLARNEMFARHGLIFKSSPNLQKFFESKSWYKPNENYTGDLDTDVENYNAGMIKAIEFLKMAQTNNASITSDYVLPQSNSKEYSASDISKLNDWELIVAKNEIYARYGLEFSTKELLDHFKSKSWFKIDSSVGNDLVLNSTEEKNIALLVAEEQNRYYPRLNHDLAQ